MLETYTLPQIKEAVDIAIGDDGFRSKEVIEILKLEKKERIELDRNSTLQLIDKMQELEQNIINVDAKYKKKINEIMFLIEPPPSSQELIDKSKDNKENINEKISKK